MVYYAVYSEPDAMIPGPSPITCANIFSDEVSGKLCVERFLSILPGVAEVILFYFVSLYFFLS